MQISVALLVERSSAARPEGAFEGTHRRDRRVQTPQPPPIGVVGRTVSRVQGPSFLLRRTEPLLERFPLSRGAILRHGACRALGCRSRTCRRQDVDVEKFSRSGSDDMGVHRLFCRVADVRRDRDSNQARAGLERTRIRSCAFSKYDPAFAHGNLISAKGQASRYDECRACSSGLATIRDRTAPASHCEAIDIRLVRRYGARMVRWGSDSLGPKPRHSARWRLDLTCYRCGRGLILGLDISDTVILLRRQRRFSQTPRDPRQRAGEYGSDESENVTLRDVRP